MGFLARLFGRPQRTRIKTTVDRPLAIIAPTIGFLNLQGPAGARLEEMDRSALSGLFAATRSSTHDPPRCNVLFIYCSMDAGGSIVGSRATVRDLIIAAQAHVVVVASEIGGKVLPRAVKRAVARREEWRANIVWTIDRKGEKFGQFFRRIFDAMFYGQSMLIAWVKAAPQVPPGHPAFAQNAELPGTVLMSEAGHIVFRQGP